MEINVAIVGLVSQGKSTLLNALLMDTLAKTEHKRSTMLPQVYVSSSTSLTAENAYKTNERANLAASEKRERGKFTQEDCIEIIHYMEIGDRFITLPEGVKLAVYDIPGLNDGGTGVYYQYLSSKIKTFDIILLVVDIQGALNTQDDMVLLSALEDMRRDARLIVIINKCDDVIIGENGDPQFEDRELKECHHQILNVLSKKYTSMEYDVVCMSAMDAYVYRTLKRNPNAVVDIKYINRVLTAEIGSKRCKLTKEENRRKRVSEIMSKSSDVDMIQACGMSHLLGVLAGYSSKEKIAAMLLGKVRLVADTITRSGDSIDSCLEYLSDFIVKVVQPMEAIGKLQPIPAEAWILTYLTKMFYDELVKPLKSDTIRYCKSTLENKPFCCLLPMTIPTTTSKVGDYIQAWKTVKLVYKCLKIMDSPWYSEIQTSLDAFSKMESYHALLWLQQGTTEDHKLSFYKKCRILIDEGIHKKKDLYMDHLLMGEVDWLGIDRYLPILLKGEPRDILISLMLRKSHYIRKLWKSKKLPEDAVARLISYTVEISLYREFEMSDIVDKLIKDGVMRHSEINGSTGILTLGSLIDKVTQSHDGSKLVFSNLERMVDDM